MIRVISDNQMGILKGVSPQKRENPWDFPTSFGASETFQELCLKREENIDWVLTWRFCLYMGWRGVMDHWESKRVSEETSTSALLAMPKPLTVWITTNCGKFLEIGIADQMICLLRNLYAGQEAKVRTGHGTTDCFQIGKGVHQGCILSPCLFSLHAEYIMRNAVWSTSWNQGFQEK